ncbi:VWFA and cache domain-containing protein 1 [Lingula anatina]|uniref:VWFA and cache domain-containing protein 1 n=1 Tax=Lingula anatina TaxID=7574 RepID=A0A1S3KEL5_LINAN|nr:VWFA and cache domain-containing protein 1 [Lingula anatina]|eukprot:XP_013420899.1 VWFA and cache domain-containing protein 1 [Lingula anatina]
MQAEYDKVSYREDSIDGPGNIRELANSLRTKFQGPISALTKIKDAIEDDYASFSSVRSMTQCCQVVEATYDKRFSQEVNFDKACVTIAGQSSVNKKFPTARVVEVMKENVRINPNLKWQYFGGEDGILLNYPAVKPTGVPDCDSYDPRFRPFYVSAATPVPKDIVVVIDTSGSMTTYHNSKTLLQIAKDAARTVVETLSANDRVGLVSFSSAASTPVLSESTCYTTSLAAATPQNAKNLKKYIDSLRAGGATNYQAAMEKAFSLFNSSENSFKGEKRNKVILFLTDGKRTQGGNPLETIRDQNAILGNQVLILTFGLGQSLEESSLAELRNMAAQTLSNQFYGEITAGTFTHVTDPNRLRSAMASYYDIFSSTGSPIIDPQFSVPYIDLFGTGLITSVCLPAYHSGRLIGVACSDVAMSELLSEATYFDKGELSYAFVINGYGRTYSHPLLPRPYDVTDDPIFVDIHHLERAPAAKSVISSMIRGEEGNSSFVSTRTQARGDVFREGVSLTNVMSHYYWAPIPGSNISVCLVIGEGDKISVPSPQTATSAMFNYHRYDLKPPSSPCKHFSRYASKGSSAVMLTPGAFRQPYHYLNTEETATNVTQYERYLTGQSSQNPGLKTSILDSVVITYKAEEIWKRKPADFVVYRSIGTMDGLMRLLPGLQLTKNYDHTRRAWFKRTLTYKGTNVVSPPYLDVWGSGYVITLSHTLYEGKSGGVHTPNDKVTAVILTDFTITYFYQVIQDRYVNCRDAGYSCLVMDSSGFIVMHDDFVKATDTPDIENVHILKKEPVIGSNLVTRGLLSKRSCLDFESIKEQYFWQVNLPNPNGLDLMQSSPSYEIRPIPNSNIYLIIYSKKMSESISCSCPFGSVSPSKFECSPRQTCECPCHSKADNFNYCTNFYTLLYDSAQTCASPAPDLTDIAKGEVEKVKDLDLCIPVNCSAKSSQDSCFSVAGCSWCSLGKRGETLASPFCASQSVCYFGKLAQDQPCTSGTCSDPDGGTQTSGENNAGAVAGGVIGAVILLILIIIIFMLYKKGKICASKPRTPSNVNSPGSNNLAFSDITSPPVNPSAPPSFGHVGVDPPPSYTEVYQQGFTYK